MIKKRLTREITLGDCKVGGGAPVSVQSMTTTKTEDQGATVAQIRQLEEVGCEIIRVAVPHKEAAGKLGKIKSKIRIPLVADVHFDYRLALMSLEEGVDGLRINPGNIGGRDRVEKIVDKARDLGIPIRIGVNSGSLENDLLVRHGGPTSKALAESALRWVKVFEELKFYDIKLSVKSSDVLTTVESYRIIAGEVNYPLHLGITEAGTIFSGTIKSTLGIGILLSEGIGDTIRVSLTADPREEIHVGYQILKALKLRHAGIEVVSCPTCGRCEIDLIGIATEVEKKLTTLKSSIKVAVMGCMVNGPGEAKEADIGIAGGKKKGILFKKGEIIRKLTEEEMVETLVCEVNKMTAEK